MAGPHLEAQAADLGGLQNPPRHQAGQRTPRRLRQVPPCRCPRRRYAVEHIDLLGMVALLKPSLSGRTRWRVLRVSHGHGPLPDSGRERTWMRQNAAHSMMTAATSLPAGEDRTALIAHPC